MKEDVEREWAVKVAAEARVRAEKEAWADEVVRQLERERAKAKAEEERLQAEAQKKAAGNPFSVSTLFSSI